MKTFDVYINGKYFDTFVFDSRKTESQAYNAIVNAHKLVGNISVIGVY